MPTATEKRALGFFAGVILLGAGVRVVGAAGEGGAPADAHARAALHRQIASVDSARQAGGGRRGGRGERRQRSPDDSTAAGGRPAPTVHGGAWREASARPRVYHLRQRPAVGRLGDDTLAALGSGALPAPRAPVSFRVDVDVASAADLERLPRIGPALAQRIVADRAVRGPFGSLEALTRVRGIGPSTARLLAPYVTFTLTPRPSGEGDGAPGAAGGRGRRLRKPRSP